MPKQFESAVVNTQPSITNSKKPRIKIDTDLESGDIVTCSKINGSMIKAKVFKVLNCSVVVELDNRDRVVVSIDEVEKVGESL